MCGTVTVGWSGGQCQYDRDERTLDNMLCKNGTKCINTPGSYTCVCISGWTGADCGTVSIV